MSEVQGFQYDESEMALFQAKLSYYSTFESRIDSEDANLKSITGHQASILKQWEILKRKETEMTEKNGGIQSPAHRRQLDQYEWRYKNLERTATGIKAT
jgi:hypothetical protein